VSVSKLHAFRHQRESEYRKLLSVSKVTIVVEVWGEVVAVATFRIGTRLAGYGTTEACTCGFCDVPNIIHDQ